MASGLTHLKDEFGNDFYLGQAGDVLMPAYPTVSNFREQLRHVRQMEIKPNDVILTGFPKSGTHWMQEIIYMLLTGTTEYDREADIERRIDFFHQEPGSNPPESPPRVFTSNLRFHLLPKQVLEKGVKVIHLQRNPKDVWVSYYNHMHNTKGTLYYGGTWDHFFKLMISFGYAFGDWFDYVLDWEQVIEKYSAQVPFYTAAYEDLKKDLVGEIGKLDDFLGCKRGREFHSLVAQACSFRNLKREKDQSFPEDLREKMWQNKTVALYRKGEVGDWKNWFTVAQNELFDEVFKRRMADSNLRFTFVQ